MSKIPDTIPRLQCPNCNIVVAVSYPRKVWCTDCEIRMEEI